MSRVKTHYLFPEIQLRKQAFLKVNPEAQLISLGVGDTSEPLSPFITHSLAHAARGLGTRIGYRGYGPEQGFEELRKKIASYFYSGLVNHDDIFISDGAKCDIGRLQLLFGPAVSIALQDPTYPVYLEGSLMQGVQKIHLMPCLPENDFFPDLNALPPVDLIYFCSPNNPTGATATKKQLQELIQFAKAHRSIILFDSAYAHYIQDPLLPRSIFEIDGADEVAIEIGSFSKLVGFTGVRLGWSVVPEALRFEDGSSVKSDWKRLISTLFNGASNLAQSGGCAVLEKEGIAEMNQIIAFYKKNSSILHEAVVHSTEGKIFGGSNAPYLWWHFEGKKSWNLFQELLETLHLVTTPGSGFGPSGEGFVRLSAFGSREQIIKAADRLTSLKGALR